MTTSSYVRSLADATSTVSSRAVAVRPLSGKSALSLGYMAMKHVLLAPGTVRGPHWHEDASELVFCLSGTVLVSILGDGNACESIVISSGAMVYFASGALQTIENVGDTFAELVVVTSLEESESRSLLHVFTAMAASPDVDGYTSGAGTILKPSLALGRKASIWDRARTSGYDEIGEGYFAGCSVQPVRPDLRPVLKDLSLCLPPGARSSSHAARTYPNHVAMAYIHKGKARLSVLDPLGQVETYELNRAACPGLSRRSHVGEQPANGGTPPIIVFEQPMLADAIYRSATCSLTSSMLSAMCDLEDSSFHLPSCERSQKVAVRWINLAERFRERGP